MKVLADGDEKWDYFVLKCTTAKAFQEENFERANLLFSVGNFVPW